MYMMTWQVLVFTTPEVLQNRIDYRRQHDQEVDQDVRAHINNLRDARCHIDGRRFSRHEEEVRRRQEYKQEFDNLDITL